MTINDETRSLAVGGRGAVALMFLNDLGRNPVILQCRTSEGRSGRSIRALRFSLDGRWLAAGDDDGGLYLWRANDVENTEVFRAHEHDAEIHSIAFSSDGKSLASSDGNGVVCLWELGGNQRLRLAARLTEHTSRVYAVEFSPDGKWLATGSQDRTCRLWARDDHGEWASRFVLRCDDTVSRIAVSSDSKWLAAACLSGSVRIWNLRADDPSQLSVVIAQEDREHARYPRPSSATSLRFSTDDCWLVVADRAGRVRRVPLCTQELLEQARGAVGRNFSEREWQQYFYGEPWRPTFPALPSP